MTDASVPPGWTVVIPVKGTAASKSRFGGDAVRRGDLAMAIALDTVAAAAGARSVDRIIVVTSAHAAPFFAVLGVGVVVEPARGGTVGDAVDDIPAGAIPIDAADRLNAAVELGLLAAGREATTAPVAVLLGDVPALTGDELDDALAQAARHPLAMVPDADGIGTVLLTATAGHTHRPAFGGPSRAAHRSAGYTEITVSVTSGLRRDVDTLDQLEALRFEGIGPRTAAAG